MTATPDPLRAAILGDGPQSYRCPACGNTDPNAYLRCQWAGCLDGRDPRPGLIDATAAAARVRAMMTSPEAIRRAAGTVGAPRDAMTEEAERIALKAILAALGDPTS